MVTGKDHLPRLPSSFEPWVLSETWLALQVALVWKLSTSTESNTVKANWSEQERPLRMMIEVYSAVGLISLDHNKLHVWAQTSPSYSKVNIAAAEVDLCQVTVSKTAIEADSEVYDPPRPLLNHYGAALHWLLLLKFNNCVKPPSIAK